MKEYTIRTDFRRVIVVRVSAARFSWMRISAMSIDTATFPTLEGFDPFGADFLSDPAPTIKRAQATKPVFYNPPLHMWVITRNEDICPAARDWRRFRPKLLV
jgi:hypothetical protein